MTCARPRSSCFRRIIRSRDDGRTPVRRHPGGGRRRRRTRRFRTVHSKVEEFRPGRPSIDGRDRPAIVAHRAGGMPLRRLEPGGGRTSDGDPGRGCGSNLEGTGAVTWVRSFELRSITRPGRAPVRARALGDRPPGGLGTSNLGGDRTELAGGPKGQGFSAPGRRRLECPGQGGASRGRSDRPNGRSGFTNASMHSGRRAGAVRTSADGLLTSVSSAAPLC